MVADDIEVGQEGRFENARTVGVFDVLFPVERVQQGAYPIVQPGRKDHVGRDDFAEYDVQRTRDSRAHSVNALGAKAFEHEVCPGIRLRVAILQYTGRSKRNTDLLVRDDANVDFRDVAKLVDDHVDPWLHRQSPLGEKRKHPR
jgi:hypothetical protein